MKRSVCNFLGHIPIVGKLIKAKYDFFTFPCSPLMEEFSKTGSVDVVKEWMKKHPNQAISPEKVKEIVSK